MNKAEVFRHYSSILDYLIDNYDFCKLYFQNPISLDCELVDEVTSLLCGASRGCLVTDGCDWVVKFDLEDKCYCEKEVDLYEAAMEEGLENFLAEPVYIGTYFKKIEYYAWDYDYRDEIEYADSFDKEFEYSGEWEEVKIELPLYAYPYAASMRFPYVSLKEVQAIKKSPLTERNQVVGYTFQKNYKEKELDAFINFLEEHKINDLHCGNVGEVGGKPVLIDYAGYDDYEDY